MLPSNRVRPVIRTACRACRSNQTAQRGLGLLSIASAQGRTPSSRLRRTQPPTFSAFNDKAPIGRSTWHDQRRYATSDANLKITPLYDLHTSLGAKMVPFANFSMPLDYPGQSHPESHRWTRSHASLFDVSHMVQHKLSGPLAEDFLMTITPSAIDALPKHTSTLSTLLSTSGGIVDDTVITRLGRDSFYFVTNAGCREPDLEFIKTQRAAFLDSQGATDDAINWHILDHHSLLALQGPQASTILQSLLFQDEDEPAEDTDLSTLYFSHSRWLRLNLPGSCVPEHTELSTPSLLITRTGYTGEDGFEISIPPENGSSANLAMSIAKAFTESEDCQWAGLAARDSLRLEAGMCLYGHDIGLDTTPAEAGLGWVVPKSKRGMPPKPAFNGWEVVNKQLSEPKTIERRRVGLVVEAGSAAREGAEIVVVNEDASQGELVGKVTSGCPGPSMDGKNIAMGYVKTGWHKRGTKLGVLVRKKVRKAEVVKMPFWENKFYRGTD